MKHHGTTILSALALTLMCAAGCDAEEAESAEFRALADNSAELNGIVINGIVINGIVINGIVINGIVINGGETAGVTLESALAPDGDDVQFMWTSISSGRMMMITKGGNFFSGTGAVGTELTFNSDEGDYRLFVDDIEYFNGGEFKGGSLYHYDLTYEVKGESGWTGDKTPLCYDGQGNPTQALILPGEWDQETGDRLSYSATSLTAACRQGALAKCAEWGYRPGLMPNTHQTCLRMVRADYDGSGVPHTLNGTEINVGDVYGINYQASEPGLMKEAEWGPNGAICLNREFLRHPELTGCEDPNDPETCFPGIPECWGAPENLKIYLYWWGARMVTAIGIAPQ